MVTRTSRIRKAINDSAPELLAMSILMIGGDLICILVALPALSGTPAYLLGMTVFIVINVFAVAIATLWIIGGVRCEGKDNTEAR